jgi:hypothetical protein
LELIVLELFVMGKIVFSRNLAEMLC